MHAQLFIGGRWEPGTGADVRTVRSPATGEAIGTAVMAGADDGRRAVQAAVDAGPLWRQLSPRRRSEALESIARWITDHVEDLARWITREEGKPLPEARGEVHYCASFLRFYAAEAQRITGEIPPSPEAGRSLYLHREPIGVTLAITPWNYPMAMIARKLAAALAAGCTVVVKPAEQTPLCAAALFQGIAAALPAGVANLVNGLPDPLGESLIHDAQVRKITFTGSTQVGRHILHAAADRVASVSLELGGNAPFIVMDDAAIEEVVLAVLRCKYRNAGQICVALNRLYVQRPIHDTLAEALRQAVGALKVGDGLEPGTDIGPMINQAALEKVEAHVSDAQQRGAHLLVGGRRLHAGGHAQGFFYAPSLLTQVPDGARMLVEETFGPVAPLMAFDTETEVIARANDTPYGLAAYVFTRDLGRAERLTRGLHFGMIGVNDPVPSLAEVAIGGMKESGLGREGGRQGLDEFLEWKYVSVRHPAAEPGTA